MTHRRSRLRPWLALIACAAVLLAQSGAAHAGDAGAERRLQDVRARIQALTDRLNQVRSRHAALASRLRETEVRIGEVSRRLQGIAHRLEKENRRLGVLDRRRGRAAESLARQREALARQIRASYAMGRQDYLKLLLNQEDPSRVMRALTYYAYFNRARSRRMAAIRDELDELRKVGGEIRDQRAALQSLLAKQSDVRDELERQRSERSAVLASLSHALSAGGEKLSLLRQNEKKLQQLVEGLRQELSDIPGNLDSGAPFSSLRGHLPWPAAGSIVHGFGSARSPGDLTWKGVWIGAPQGEAVHAISHGRVAYADWLRGFGLLLIIDHGGGYMTLYGHNEGLYKEVGDWVRAGEVVATVGDSGGNQQSGLYFEIRHDGVPTDPARWCSNAAASAGGALVTR